MSQTNEEKVRGEIVKLENAGVNCHPAPTASPDQALFNPEAGPMAFWCPWKTDDDEGQALVMQCLNGADKRLSDCINETMEVESVFIQPVDLVDADTGEVSRCPRIVLVRPDRVTVGCVSQGVYNSLRAILAMKGRGPWKPALLLRMRQIATRSGNRTFVLDLMVRPNEPAAPGKGGNGAKKA